MDNNNYHWDQYYTIDEPGLAEYVFDELHILQNASLTLTTEAGVTKTLIAKKVNCILLYFQKNALRLATIIAACQKNYIRMLLY